MEGLHSDKHAPLIGSPSEGELVDILSGQSLQPAASSTSGSQDGTASGGRDSHPGVNSGAIGPSAADAPGSPGAALDTPLERASKATAPHIQQRGPEEHAGRDGAGTQERLAQLCRFEGLCSSLFRDDGGRAAPLHPPGATLDELARALTDRLGPALLGDLQDERDEWQRLADLLAAASGMEVTRTAARSFFRQQGPSSRAVVDYQRMHAAGLHPAAWPLPLEHRGARRAAVMQHAVKEDGGGYGAGVLGRHLQRYSSEDDVWSWAAVAAFHPGDPPLHILVLDSGRRLAVDLAGETVVFRPLPPLDAQQVEQASHELARSLPEARLLPLPQRAANGSDELLGLVASSLQRVVPATRGCGPVLETTASAADLLREWLGSEAPQYDPAGQAPLAYIERLLRWGAPPGARLQGCVTPPADGKPAVVDLAALHAVGCFPHAWQVPLTAAAVQAANRQVCRASAARPLQVLQLAVAEGRQGMRQPEQEVARSDEADAPMEQPQQQQQQQQPQPQQQQKPVLQAQARCSVGKRKQTQPKHLSQQPVPPVPSPQQAQQPDAHEGGPGPQPPEALPGWLPRDAPVLKSGQAWKFAPGGWISRKLPKTAMRNDFNGRFALPDTVFTWLTGQRATSNGQTLEVDAWGGASYRFLYRKGRDGPWLLQGTDWRRWVLESGAKEGDWMWLKQGQRVQIKLTPAAEASPSTASATTSGDEAQAGRLQPKTGQPDDRKNVPSSRNWRHGTSGLLPLLVSRSRAISERGRAMFNGLRRLIPSFRTAARHLHNSPHAAQQKVLGSEAPQYDPARQEPHAYIEQLLRWGAPPGAKLQGCVTPPADGKPAVVDLAALHAVGCFPHAWQVPLTAAGVQAANQRMEAPHADDPGALLEEAMQQGLGRGNASTKRAAKALKVGVGGGSSKRARASHDAEEEEDSLSQPSRPLHKRRRQRSPQRQRRLQREEEEQEQELEEQSPRQQQQQRAATVPHAPQPPLGPEAVSAALASLAARITERSVEDARAAIVAAARDPTVGSMLRPLQQLVLARKGGEALRDVVHRWQELTAEQQTAVFNATVVALSSGSLDELEEWLRLALAVATPF